LSGGLLAAVGTAAVGAGPAWVAGWLSGLDAWTGGRLLAPGDALAGTLRLLPVLLAAFYAIHRTAVRRGARRLAAAGSARELAALALLVPAALARPALGLGLADEVIAAGLLLVLAHRVVRQLVALRPLLGHRLGPRPAAVFFWLPLAVYLAILPWSSGHRQPDGDEPYNLLLTHSLAYDGDTDLRNNYAAGDWRFFMDHAIRPQPGDPVGLHGEIYSRHNALLPLVLAPAYRLAGKTGAQIVMALLAAALAWWTLRLARHYTASLPGETLVAWGWFALAPPLLLYTYQIWVEIPAALLLVVALDTILAGGRELEPEPEPAAPAAGLTAPGAPPAVAPRGRRRADLVALWGAVLLLPLLKIRFILVAAPLVALTAWQATRRSRQWRQAGALAVLLAALSGAILLYNQRVFANPLKIHSWQEIDPQQHSPLDYLEGGLGLFYDAAFGLFGFAPIWLLLVPAAVVLVRRRAVLPAHLTLLTAPYVMVVMPRGEWYGGWSPPFRYALLALPLLALCLPPLLAGRHRPGARALLAGLGALTLTLSLLWLVVPGWTFNFADGRTYLLDHLSARLGEDVARFFPSSIRPRTATWLWPPCTIVLLLAVWRLPWPAAARRRSALGTAGIAAAALAAALVPYAAARVPTRVIEMEDPQVVKLGGHLYPDRWVIERTLYRGGWVLRVADQVRAPVVAGGSRVALTLTAELIRNQPAPFAVDISAGNRLLAVWTPVRERAWQQLTLGPFDWPRGEPLVLSAHGPSPPGALNGAILDRVDLAWQR
jgi:hypothetical protein